MTRRFLLSVAVAALSAVSSISARGADLAERWSVEKAKAWQSKVGWLVGANFGPSTAINQLEMWQADTFDVATIDRELGWAEGLGFNSMRVFLHDLLWQQDSEGFLKRMDQFLGLCEKHKIGVMFVLFDSVWDPDPVLGKQREPKKGLHNSGWVQSPGRTILSDPSKYDSLKPYVQGVISRFKDDARVQCWDIINEPDNMNGSSYKAKEPEKKHDLALKLLEKSFAWAREINPSQPLTSGVWVMGNMKKWGTQEATGVEKFCYDQSDVITYHCYDPLDTMKNTVEQLRKNAQDRPLLCTEYMARPQGSTFDPHLGYLKEANVGAYNWGFVAGKTNTIYPWDSWKKAYDAEPPVWFHDIFRADGTAYIPSEVEAIRKVTGKK